MKQYIVRIPERIEHVVTVKANNPDAAHAFAYDVVMNGDPYATFGTNYSVESLGTDGANATVEEV